MTHRFSNNAITTFSSFADIEDHLVKQWSMTFQRLLREERDKGLEARRADAMIEQIQDLKAVVLQSIGVGSGREIAKAVLRYRRLIDFLLALRRFRSAFDIVNFNGTFDSLLGEFDIIGVRVERNNSMMPSKIILLRNDDTYYRVRVPERRFAEFGSEWASFSQLERETKRAVVEGLEEMEQSPIPMLMHLDEPYPAPPASSWSEERVDRLKEMWEAGFTASQIAETLGGVSRNAVIGKAFRIGLQSRPAPKLDSSDDD